MCISCPSLRLWCQVSAEFRRYGGYERVVVCLVLFGLLCVIFVPCCLDRFGLSGQQIVQTDRLSHGYISHAIGSSDCSS